MSEREVADLKFKLALEEASHAKTIAKDNAELDRLRAENERLQALADSLLQHQMTARIREMGTEADRDELLALVRDVLSIADEWQGGSPKPVMPMRLASALERARARLAREDK